MNLKNFYAIVCALMCAFAVACSQPTEPLPLPEAQATSETGAATRAGQTIVIDETTQLELSPGAVLSAAAEGYFDKATISGAASVLTGVDEEYSVPSTTGHPTVTLTGWTVTPTGGFASSIPSTYALTLNFSTSGNRQIKANFTIIGGTATLIKNIVVNYPTPKINNITVSPNSGIYPGDWVVFTAGVEMYPGDQIQWRHGSGCDPTSGTPGGTGNTRTYGVRMDTTTQAPYVTVQCRVGRGATWSNWASSPLASTIYAR